MEWCCGVVWWSGVVGVVVEWSGGVMWCRGLVVEWFSVMKWWWWWCVWCWCREVVVVLWSGGVMEWWCYGVVVCVVSVS